MSRHFPSVQKFMLCNNASVTVRVIDVESHMDITLLGHSRLGHSFCKPMYGRRLSAFSGFRHHYPQVAGIKNGANKWWTSERGSLITVNNTLRFAWAGSRTFNQPNTLRRTLNLNSTQSKHGILIHG